jgi:hypothetical protein
MVFSPHQHRHTGKDVPKRTSFSLCGEYQTESPHRFLVNYPGLKARASAFTGRCTKGMNPSVLCSLQPQELVFPKPASCEACTWYHETKRLRMGIVALWRWSLWDLARGLYPRPERRGFTPHWITGNNTHASLTRVSGGSKL